MLYGYIRVSTGTQAMHGYSLEEQKRALMNAGVEEKRIFGLSLFGVGGSVRW